MFVIERILFIFIWVNYGKVQHFGNRVSFGWYNVLIEKKKKNPRSSPCPPAKGWKKNKEKMFFFTFLIPPNNFGPGGRIDVLLLKSPRWENFALSTSLLANGI